MSLTRTWVPDWPCPIGSILGALRHGTGDPTYAVTSDGAIWRAVGTPDGPATVRVVASGPRIEAEAWGEGAEWVLDSLPAMLGGEDDPTGFVPVHDVLITALRQRPHLRVPRTRRVWEALVPAVLEQKVTGKQASGAFRSLLRQYGEPAPGPELGLRLIPSPDVVAQVPSWAWLKMQVEPAASRTLVNGATRAAALERTLDLDSDAADRALRSLPGIGVWTSAEVRARAHGDPDAISFGDFHIAKDIGYALTGEATDDAGLERLLEPYRGHRLRVQMLLAGVHRPRRGPRMSVPTHLPR